MLEYLLIPYLFYAESHEKIHSSKYNFLLGNLAGIPYDTKQYANNLATQTSPGPSVNRQTLGALGTLGSAYFMGKNR